MTCSRKVFLIFHDLALGACESVLQKIFPTGPARSQHCSISFNLSNMGIGAVVSHSAGKECLENVQNTSRANFLSGKKFLKLKKLLWLKKWNLSFNLSLDQATYSIPKSSGLLK